MNITVIKIIAQYIDKDALVAEMENLENTYNKCPTRNSYEDGLKEGRLIGYKDALHKINTLEVKEVDLNYIKDKLDEVVKRQKPNGEFGWGTLYNVAVEFFELGLKYQKEE